MLSRRGVSPSTGVTDDTQTRGVSRQSRPGSARLDDVAERYLGVAQHGGRGRSTRLGHGRIRDRRGGAKALDRVQRLAVILRQTSTNRR